MSDELEKLRALGAQKIHEDTHIALAHVQSVIHESFEELTQIQFLGFISILEREYQFNLSFLKEKGLAYFLEENQTTNRNTKIFLTPKKVYNFTWLYILVAFLVFIIAVYYTTLQSNIDQKVSTLDNSAIENATSKITPKLDTQEKNISLISTDTMDSANITLNEVNSSNNKAPLVTTTAITPSKVSHKKQKVQINESAKKLIITPKSRVWIGYINTNSGIKKQEVTNKKLTLDASQTWLLSFGHTHIKISIDKQSVKLPSSNKSMRFIYKDNRLKKLTINEFKKLNKGRIW